VSRERFRTSPAFAGSRQAASEFGKASQCAVLLRRELAQVLELLRENELHLRLSQKIGRLLREKRLSGSPAASLNAQPWDQLEGFKFNEKTSLDNLVEGRQEVTVSPESGKINIRLADFGLDDKYDARKAGTHYRIVACASAIDFNKKKAVSDYTATDHIPIVRPVKEHYAQAPVELSLTLPAPVIFPRFVALGIVCYSFDKGGFTMLGNRSFKALELLYARPPEKTR
jgi:hypothetical protein